MKKKRTGFEKFAQRFLVVTFVIFVFGIISVKALESSYNREYQKLEQDIATTKSTIDGLKMQKQELVSFDRLTSIASSKGYKYRSDAVASAYTNTLAGSE